MTEINADALLEHHFIVLIPAYQPSRTLLDLVRCVMDEVGKEVSCIVVDDGSTEFVSREVFKELQLISGVGVITHHTNLGKGAALKTGLAHISQKFPKAGFVITADADGQHLPKDIIRVILESSEKSTLLMGVRSFDSKVPLRSRFGNIISRIFFRLFFFKSVSDTQSGLRSFSTIHIPWILKIKTNEYQFELDVLIEFTQKMNVVELPIDTVYEPGNPTSHFHPILDSAKVFATLFRHTLNVMLVGLLDYICFATLIYLNFSIFESLVLARSLSTGLYFYTANKLVFLAKQHLVIRFLSFSLLVALNIALLGPFIMFMSQQFSISPYFSMFFGYALLFITNFILQYYVIFRNNIIRK